MPLIRINDVDIQYRIDDLTESWRDRRSVKTLLMHHSSLRGLESLTPLVPYLAGKYRVVRFDSRGVGGSSAPPEPFQMTIAQLVNDTVSLMDGLGLDKVHFMGSQSGGIVGQIIAASHPERVMSLTLCSSPHKLTDSYKAGRAMGEKEPGDAIKKLGFREWREKTWHLAVDMRTADPKMVVWHKELQSRVPLHILTSQMKDLAMRDTTEILKDIKCPTLLINGDRGNVVPLEMLAFMGRQIPNSRIVIFPNVGDSVHLIMHKACAEAMLNFITEIDGESHEY